MTLSRREFIQNLGGGLSLAGTSACALAGGLGEEVEGASESEKLLVPDRLQPEPAPNGTDRLPLSWHQERTRLLKEKVAERGIDAILLRSDQNQVYFTGCFRQSGERSTWVLFPVAEKDTVYW
ncbi:MAG: aminopeptidase P family N-terminal domain-containing protein, partial [Vicinamibacteria bacterium]